MASAPRRRVAAPRRASPSPGPAGREGCCTPPPAPPAPVPAPAPSTVPVLKALAEPARLWIVRRLAAAAEPVCVCDLVADAGLGQPTVSHHLAVLRRAGLVTSTTAGRWAYYRLAPGPLRALLVDLERLLPPGRVRAARGRTR